jgi:signal transduction histidine kinase
MLKETSAVDSYVTRGNGERVPAELTLSKLELQDEEYFLLIFLDASSKHAIEAAKREFVAMVSHDLRTPLSTINSVLVYLEMGSGGELSPTGADLATRARKENERLIELVRDLLDMERMHAGKFTMHFRNLNLKQIINDAMNAVKSQADAHNVTIRESIPGELKSCCDGARIIQVVINLLDNAIKFSPKGESIELAAQVDSDGILITVSNRGRQIPAEKIQTIFESFEQVDEADARVRKGSGLGLAICKTIIEQHSGKIWAVSNASETCFHFVLPLESTNV